MNKQKKQNRAKSFSGLTHQDIQKTYDVINEGLSNLHDNLMEGIRDKAKLTGTRIALDLSMTFLHIHHLNHSLMKMSHATLIISDRQRQMEQIIRKIVNVIEKTNDPKSKKRMDEIEKDLQTLNKFQQKIHKAISKKSKEIKKKKALRPSYIE